MSALDVGIARVLPAELLIYVRGPDGRLWLKAFPRGGADVLDVAAADFRKARHTWAVADDAAENEPELTLVWATGARLYVSGEAAITARALDAAQVDLVVSLNEIGEATRDAITNHLAARNGARHVDRPIRDVLPVFQTPRDAEAAREAFPVAIERLAAGGSVLVHCLMGIHRSVSFASVLLARAGHVPTPRDGYARIHAARPVAARVPETVDWLDALAAPRSASPTVDVRSGR